MKYIFIHIVRIKLKLFIFYGEKIKLGTFSISLSVNDIETSKSFYEKFGLSLLEPDCNLIKVDQHISKMKGKI